jgi:peroxiredoxin
VRQTFRLSERRARKRLILAFYPFNWLESSARQMASYQSQRERLLASNIEAVAINVESIMNTTAWERVKGPFDLPLCSDFWPHGEVCSRYGVLRQSGAGAGASERAVFLVDGEGRIAFRKIYGWDEVPQLDEVLSQVEKS